MSTLLYIFHTHHGSLMETATHLFSTRKPQTSSTEKRKYNFKTESYGIIHTFKNYFTTIFLVFSNKRYANRLINNYYYYATMKMLCDTTRSVRGAVRCCFGSFLAKTITAPYLIFAVTCAMMCMKYIQ